MKQSIILLITFFLLTNVFLIQAGAADTKDTLEIKELVRNAGVGGTIVLDSNRVYQISSSIELMEGQTLKGIYGNGKIRPFLKVVPDANKEPFPIITLTDKKRASIIGLRLHGNKGARKAPRNITRTSNIFALNRKVSGEKFTFRDLYVHNSYGRGIRVLALKDQKVKNSVEIFNSKVYNCDLEGILISGSQDSVIRDTDVFDNKRSGISLFRGHNIAVTGSKVFRNTNHGIVFQYSTNIRILDNLVRDNGHLSVGKAIGYGITAGGGEPRFLQNRNFTISSNQLYRNHHGGISIDPTIRGQKRILYQGATVNDNVVIGTSIHGIHLTHSNYVTLRNNKVSNVKVAALALHTSRNVRVHGGTYRGERWGVSVAKREGVLFEGRHFISKDTNFKGAECDVKTRNNTEALAGIVKSNFKYCPVL